MEGGESRLDDANLVCNIEGIVILREANVCLLLTIRPDESFGIGSDGRT